MCELNVCVGSVFHAALIFFAALQIHETKTALVRLPDCDSTVDFVVRLAQYRAYGLANSHVPFSSNAAALGHCSERWSIYSSLSRVPLRPPGLS